MNVKEAESRIKYLREQIAYNSKLYYENDAPAISDYEYDMMFRELGELEAQFPELDSPTSPTKRVGGKALDKFEKFTLLGFFSDSKKGPVHTGHLCF